jgi:hypothetical protein
MGLAIQSEIASKIGRELADQVSAIGLEPLQIGHLLVGHARGNGRRREAVLRLRWLQGVHYQERADAEAADADHSDHNNKDQGPNNSAVHRFTFVSPGGPLQSLAGQSNRSWDFGDAVQGSYAERAVLAIPRLPPPKSGALHGRRKAEDHCKQAAQRP